MNHEEFLYKGIFYIIDKKKLDFILNILKTDERNFFEIANLKKFFEENKLLCEEFLDFISIGKRKVDMS